MRRRFGASFLTIFSGYLLSHLLVSCLLNRNTSFLCLIGWFLDHVKKVFSCSFPSAASRFKESSSRRLVDTFQNIIHPAREKLVRCWFYLAKSWFILTQTRVYVSYCLSQCNLARAGFPEAFLCSRKNAILLNIMHKYRIYYSLHEFFPPTGKGSWDLPLTPRLPSNGLATSRLTVLRQCVSFEKNEERSFQIYVRNKNNDIQNIKDIVN